MTVKEAEKFIREHLPFIVKDKNGNPQYPYRSVNAHKQIALHLVEKLVEASVVNYSKGVLAEKFKGYKEGYEDGANSAANDIAANPHKMY